jgi:hypothetical protein
MLTAASQQAPQPAFDLVAERAAWALTQARGSQLIDPLIESLTSADERAA